MSIWERIKWYFIKKKLNLVFSIYPKLGKIVLPVKSDLCKRIELEDGTELKVFIDKIEDGKIFYVPCEEGNDQMKSVPLGSIFTITSMNGKKLFYHSGSEVDDMDKLEQQLKRTPIKTALPALLLGIAGVVTSLFISGLGGWILAAVAVILSLSSVKKLRRSKGMSDDKILVKVGMAINVIAFFLLTVLILLVIGI